MQDLLSKRIAVLMGGPSSESEISRKSANAVFDALKRKGYNVEKLEVTESLCDDVKSF